MPEIDFNEILPVGLMLGKGALIIGNDSTPSVLIMDLASGSGSYGVSQVGPKSLMALIFKNLPSFNPVAFQA